MRKSNYDKSPAIPIEGNLWKGWGKVLAQIKETCNFTEEKQRHIVVIECYHGVHHPELRNYFSLLNPSLWIDTCTLFKSVAEIEQMTYPFLTEDRLFGRRAFFTYSDYFDQAKVRKCRKQLASCSGLTIIYGHGAAEITDAYDTLIYVDMARWEIQQRFRRKEINGIGVENKEESPSYHYKRGYFVDWNMCDALKKRLIPVADYLLDTHIPEQPKLITGGTWRAALEKAAHSPFRLVPFFDPAPWGGQWMKEICDLDPNESNFGWCFDCVPEENSLYLNVSGENVEIPANDLVFYKTHELLGGPVEARFGQDFPIRFDFLDTMGGGNLSLQVHPTTQYIRDTFGVYYTQDESYYLLDAGEGATVYLGLKTGIKPEEMLASLQECNREGKSFEATRYVNQWPAQKHDHYLIPGGTVHCSGAEAMVLEISSTPSLFTFKLWDWERLGLDGLPRPINIFHGSQVIQWERQTDFVRTYLVNHTEPIASGKGWEEERTGLHENEFIETRRHWFTGKVLHNTGGGVNVLNLVEGEEAIIESPTHAFEPFVVHYAETFVIPAAVGDYTIRPYGKAEGKRCGTIKAYVRFRQ